MNKREEIQAVIEATNEDHGKVVELQFEEEMEADEEYEYYSVKAKFEDGFELQTGLALEVTATVLN